MALVALLAVGFVVYRWQHERPPYGPEVLELTATVQMLPSEKGLGADYHGMKYNADEESTVVGGRISWRPVPGSHGDWHDDGWFMIFVVDKRVDLKPPQIAGVSGSGHRVLSGGDGVENRVAEKYPWLRGAGDIKIDDHTWQGGGSALSTSPATGEVTFVAEFPRIRDGDPERRFLASAPIALSDVMVALVYIGPARQVYWATRLYG
ncbi:hypothetical protein [Catellatospora tritici]|uniref:hypothetical protein n=1 Tax=Catellatospora tritici TaxID=2851566 RepID=UPI001C2D4E29|nr:hypothetical protein [Catellatospora tritici]MBV1852863.1 hypothetical protein [Catellatospora tritici]